MRLSIVEFLLQRIAEDEAVARAAIGTAAFSEQTGRWKAVDVPDEYGARPYVMAVSASEACTQVANMEAAWERDERAAHIARYDPARVLAECAAKRRIVEECAPNVAKDWPFPDGLNLSELVVAELGQPYADHPQFQEEWRV